MSAGNHHVLEACQVEFYEGSQTIWIHAPNGTTLMRIKTNGIIRVDTCESPVSHCDLVVDSDIKFCVA